MALILRYTDVGRNLEDDAIANGGTVPAIAALLIDDGAGAPTDEANIAGMTAVSHEAARITEFVKQKTESGWQFTFVTPLAGELTVKGVGVELADGTLWKYGIYAPVTTVPDGFALEIHLLHTRADSPVAEVSVTALDIDEMAETVRELAFDDPTVNAPDESYTDAAYPFAGDVVAGDAVYLAYEDDGTGAFVPAEYRKAYAYPHDHNHHLQPANTSTDYSKIAHKFAGIADPDSNRLWLSGLPVDIAPTLEPDQLCYLSEEPGEFTTQPYEQHSYFQPLKGFTDSAGKFHFLQDLAVNKFDWGVGGPIVEVFAEEGEDVYHRVDKALRFNARVKLIVPKGVTAFIRHAALPVYNRYLLVSVLDDARLVCEVNNTYPSYSQSGDWRQVDAFILGRNGRLYFNGNGEIEHVIPAGTLLSPYSCGLISAGSYQGDMFVDVASHHLDIKLSTCFVHINGNNSRVKAALAGNQFYIADAPLSAEVDVFWRGSWSFGGGDLELDYASVTLGAGVTLGAIQGQNLASDIQARRIGYSY